MAINDNFLSSITDALVGRVSEPGKLEDVALQVQAIVQGLKKSAQTFDKFSGQMSGIFKEAARQSRGRAAEAGKAPPSAAELTQVYNKIFKPLHDEIRALVQQNSQVNRAFHKEIASNRAFEQDVKNRFARLQSKLESRASRAVSSTSVPHDVAPLQAQLSRAWNEISKLRSETKAIERTREQQMLEVIRHEARELRRELSQKLSNVGREGWIKPYVSRTRQVNTPELTALEGPSDIFVRQAIAEIAGGTTARTRRPAHSTRYGVKLGSGQSEEVTPGYLGAAAITLDRQLGEVKQFLRHLNESIGDANKARMFLGQYSQQRHYQEQRQISRGRAQQSRDNLRLGDDLSLSTITGVNTRLLNQTLPGYYEVQRDQHRDSAYLNSPGVLQRRAQVDQMLGQPWARPQREFSGDEIKAFIAKYKGNPATSSIQTAAQMASSVGHSGHGFFDLTSIMLAGQGVGRRLASTRAMEAQRAEMDRLAGSSSGGSVKSGFRNVVGSAMRGLNGPGERGAVTLDFLSPWKWGRKTAASSAPGMSAEERVLSGAPIPVAGDVRGSMRRDALESKLQKLADTVEKTTRAFQDYQNVTAPRRLSEARERFETKDAAILRGLSSTKESIAAQMDRIESRRGSLRRGADRKFQDIQGGFESTSSSLGFAELEAEMEYESAIERQARRRARISKSKAFKEGKIKESDVEGMLSGPVRSAQIRLIKAEYASKSSQLTDPEQINTLRRETAAKYALAHYGAGGGAELASRRSALAERVQGLFGGSTLAQSAESRAGRVTEDTLAKEKELDAQMGTLRQRRVTAEEKASRDRTAAAAKYGKDVNKIESDVTKKAEDAAQVRAQANRKAFSARVAFWKNEDVASGRGGSGGAGGGTKSAGGRDEFGSRSGLGVGIGFTMAAAYLGTVREIIKESTIYAARTETLTLVTEQMARVNGLNTEAVEAEVSAIRKLNITTQEANTTVQKMMFAQLDVAKATNLARTAQDAAILANVNSSEALDRIILGIVTGQTRILHNMGLQVSMVNVMRQIRSEKRAVGEKGEPTELEKRQAMLNKVLLEGAKIMGSYERSMLTAGKQFNSLQREVQEAQNAIGKEFLPEFGRAVSLMTSGLHFVQENGDAFAKLASAVASVGVAASAVGSLSFMKWLMTAGAVPWWAKAVGVGVGALVYHGLNQDDASAVTKTATEQMDAVNKKVISLQEERKALFSSKQDTPEWKNTWEINTRSLQSAANAQASINEELTRQLAEQYNKRIANLDKFSTVFENKNSTLSEKLAAAWGITKFNALGIPGLDLPTDQRGDLGELAKKKKAGIVQGMVTPGIAAEDILRAAKYQRDQKERVKLLSPSILNKEKIEVQSLIADVLNAESELNKLDEKLSETGAVGLRARKSMGSPRQKIMFDYEAQMSQISRLGGTLSELRGKASGGDLTAQSKLSQTYLQLGGGSMSVGQEKVEAFLSRRADVEGAAKEDRDIQLSKLNRQNAAQIAQIQEQTQAEKIQAATVEGNYASEADAIEKIFQLRQKTAEKTKALTEDVDQYKRQVAQNEVDREVSLLKLQEAREKGDRDRRVRETFGASERRAQRILQAPGDAETAIRDAYKVRLESTSAIEDENKRLDEQLTLLMELSDALVDLGRNKKRAAAEARVSEYEDQAGLIEQIDRVVNSRGVASKRRSLDEIERTRLGQVAIAQKRFSELQPVTPAGEQDALEEQRTRSVRQANVRAAEDAIKVMEDRVQTAVSRLHDAYQQRVSDQARISEMSATSAIEEQDSAFNAYRQRLEYVQKEFEARKKAGDAIDEAERSRDLARHEAEMEYLQQLLQQKRQQIDTIRSVSGSMFDIITSRSPNKQQQAKDFGIGLARGIGRTVFSNIAVETMKGASGSLGGVIPGQEKTTVDPVTGKITKTPTFLGKVLSGTPFGKTATDKQIEAQRAVVKATEENVKAEESLENAIKSLDQAVRAAKGLVPGDVTKSDSSVKFPGSSPFDSIPIFGGSGKDNPLIFHFGQGGASQSGANVASINIAQLGGSAVMTALPVFLVDSPFGGKSSTSFTSSILSSGGSGSSSGSGTLGALAGLVFGKKSGDDSSSGFANMFSGDDEGDSAPGTGGSAPGATWPGTNIPIPSGSGGGGSGGSGGGGGGGSSSSSDSKPNYLGGALLTGAGAYQAYSGFKKGGAGGIASGIGGVLTSAAGITSMIPGAQVAAPFLAAGAMVADLIGSIFGDSREQRGIDIQKYMAQNKYIAPTQLAADMSVAGGVVSTGAHGQLSRDSGISAFPIDFTSTQYGKTPSKTWSDPNVPEYYTIPGRQQSANLSGTGQSVTYNIHLPISAFDSKDVMARSGDIAMALKKEISGGSDVSVELQKSMFGPGLM